MVNHFRKASHNLGKFIMCLNLEELNEDTDENECIVEDNILMTRRTESLLERLSSALAARGKAKEDASEYSYWSVQLVFLELALYREGYPLYRLYELGYEDYRVDYEIHQANTNRGNTERAPEGKPPEEVLSKDDDVGIASNSTISLSDSSEDSDQAHSELIDEEEYQDIKIPDAEVFLGY